MKVYMIAESPYGGWTKIGKSGTHPKHRLADLQCGNPRPLQLMAWWHGERAKAVTGWLDTEAEIHQHFAALRGSGEWFALPASMLMEAKDLMSKEFGYNALMMRWPAERVMDLAESDDLAPQALAQQFAAPTTNHTTPNARILRIAGKS